MTNQKLILTVDAVVTIAMQDIVLIKRAKAPFMDKEVLPGGHVEVGECLKMACARELAEEIGLIVDPDELNLLTVLDNSDRDPRPGRRVSIVFHIDLPDHQSIAGCKAQTDAKEIIVRSIARVKPEEIGFDHYEAIVALTPR